MIIWSKVEEAFPCFHFKGEGYNFIKGQWNKHQHWLLSTAEKTINPWDGSEGAPVWFVETTGGRTASIDRKEEPKEEQKPKEEPKTEQKTYIVKKGDSLSKIAMKELGNGNRWPEIYELNKDQIKDPDLIQIGWELKLPN
jgi:LysM repeat protein